MPNGHGETTADYASARASRNKTEIEKISKDYGASYLFTSAKDGKNVELAFQTFATNLAKTVKD